MIFLDYKGKNLHFDNHKMVKDFNYKYKINLLILNKIVFDIWKTFLSTFKEDTLWNIQKKRFYNLDAAYPFLDYNTNNFILILQKTRRRLSKVKNE